MFACHHPERYLAPILVFIASGALAADEDIPLAKVPAAVRKAATAAAPKVKWTGASKDTEDGKVIYTLEGENPKGRGVTVEVTADAKVIEVATELPMAEVPAKVKAALKAKLPRFKVEDCFEIAHDGKVVEYQFEGRRPKDKEDIIVVVSADGKTVEIDA